MIISHILIYNKYFIILHLQKNMQQLTQQTFAQAISSWIVLVDFFAERCGPCKMIAPYIEDLSQKLTGLVNVYKVDVDAEFQIAQQYQITAMPTFVFFKDGQEVHRTRGANMQEIVETLQKLLQPAAK